MKQSLTENSIAAINLIRLSKINNNKDNNLIVSEKNSSWQSHRVL